ncbi:carboxypeptidase-like regulatory domain-containing protein [Neolewinella lacunae]|uniref:TonB-dependent receptor n=1 Tax=Neolewinella lacunae TaxID=1517758 RepID=A0A923PEM9_9BACT|nr:carboxypeptidase-like regulatory domain-containing protein [Neolewinella lacunae]MBC6992657.1 TonB-dependent receptor [Neolewinella lacunae]MDN3633537.1 carboxypeptidase-like regulatory domain-containing protein [Neolewinella lacunae]
MNVLTSFAAATSPRTCVLAPKKAFAARLCLLLALLLPAAGLLGQVATASISGKVTDLLTEQPVDFATVYIRGTMRAVESGNTGRYLINVPAGEDFVLVFSRLGYRETAVNVAALPEGSIKQIDVAMAPTESTLEVIVRESKIEEGGMIREQPEALRLLPSTTGNLESLLPHLALGVSSGSGGELTSQYNVRGGNYDENLVYVNGFEIYRPQLIRAGQQEGLTFANMDMVRSLSFSSGGFDAQYGDKLSSVLDIKYKRPDSLRAGLQASFLGGSAYLEGSSRANAVGLKKFRYLVGARYKTTRYLLGSLETTGEYLPNFADVQTYLTYDFSPQLQLGLLANYNRSVYDFDPVSRTTAFGGFFETLQLFTSFEGGERDDFLTRMGGLSLTFIPERERNPLFLKLLTSAFRSDENEAISIGGQYRLGQLDTDLGSSTFGEVINELGAGTQQQFVRNFLDIQVYNAELRGGLEMNQQRGDLSTAHFLQWSLKIQNERVNDFINEWERLDSAGYSLPYNEDAVELFSVLKTENELNSLRYTAFLQDTWTWRREDRADWRISAGLRAAYWDLNEEFLISPRAQILFKPLGGTADITYKLAGGLYAQPPFYREMRGADGTVNTNLRSQKSAHIVGGFTSDFYYGRRNPKKFRFIAEAYYKSLWDLVSYEIENVRIRYSGLNDASGYVAGLDLRLNGEFVPGADSWLNLSLLQARERLLGVEHREVTGRSAEGETLSEVVEYVPRPTDQLFQLSLFFQDYLRNNEAFRTHVNLTVGGGLPFGILNNNREFRNTLRFDTYHRIDIGFSFRLYDREKSRRASTHFLRFTRSTFLSLEVFNLMQVANQAGNTWIKTIGQQQYAVPNRLTGRRINLRLRVDF